MAPFFDFKASPAPVKYKSGFAHCRRLNYPWHCAEKEARGWCLFVGGSAREMLIDRGLYRGERWLNASTSEGFQKETLEERSQSVWG